MDNELLEKPVAIFKADLPAGPVLIVASSVEAAIDMLNSRMPDGCQPCRRRDVYEQDKAQPGIYLGLNVGTGFDQPSQTSIKSCALCGRV